MTRLVFAAFCLLMAPMTVAAEGKPNIILIMADDLGFADLGCYGSEIETPNLDSLAASGLRFTQFYNTAKCHSSRVSLLTGLYCDQAGSTRLSRGATIAEVLSSSGYFTAMVGKWHLSKQPTDFGFQRYWGHLSGATNYFTGDNTFRLNGEEWKVPQSLNGRPFYTTHAVVDFALEFLEEATRGDKPFFLYTAVQRPTLPASGPRGRGAEIRRPLRRRLGSASGGPASSPARIGSSAREVEAQSAAKSAGRTRRCTSTSARITPCARAIGSWSPPSWGNGNSTIWTRTAWN